ncbi:MAG: hypothetical protein ACI89L_000439 [Phycisphaerales bacterium]|jgi:hypothetical protein
MSESGFIDERQVAIFLSAVNAETYEKLGDESADAQGHIVSGAVLRRKSVDRSYVPVRVRVAHGVASATAVAMLRKMADLIEGEPDFLSSVPGTAIRRLPDGSSVRKTLTPEGILEAADRLDKDDRLRLMAMMEEIKLELTDESIRGERGEDEE